MLPISTSCRRLLQGALEQYLRGMASRLLAYNNPESAPESESDEPIVEAADDQDEYLPPA